MLILVNYEIGKFIVIYCCVVFYIHGTNNQMSLCCKSVSFNSCKI